MCGNENKQSKAGFHTGFLVGEGGGERMARLRVEKIEVPRPLLRAMPTFNAHLLNKVLMVPF